MDFEGEDGCYKCQFVYSVLSVSMTLDLPLRARDNMMHHCACLPTMYNAV